MKERRFARLMAEVWNSRYFKPKNKQPRSYDEFMLKREKVEEIPTGDQLLQKCLVFNAAMGGTNN